MRVIEWSCLGIQCVIYYDYLDAHINIVYLWTIIYRCGKDFVVKYKITTMSQSGVLMSFTWVADLALMFVLMNFSKKPVKLKWLGCGIFGAAIGFMDLWLSVGGRSWKLLSAVWRVATLQEFELHLQLVGWGVARREHYSWTLSIIKIRVFLTGFSWFWRVATEGGVDDVLNLIHWKTVGRIERYAGTHWQLLWASYGFGSIGGGQNSTGSTL